MDRLDLAFRILKATTWCKWLPGRYQLKNWVYRKCYGG